ncbi:MAG: hypothetical protein ACLVAW_20005, partial [Eisenbergiella massiliensis]
MDRKHIANTAVPNLFFPVLIIENSRFFIYFLPPQENDENKVFDFALQPARCIIIIEYRYLPASGIFSVTNSSQDSSQKRVKA